ncbi:MAG TPA: hydroxyacid dehydrogenase [Elusimicrobia bacterium]|nr:hydroxyacid dehydrogenase [Elusimicrobiota bacterium]
MTDNLPEKPAGKSEILFYQSEDGKSRIQVRLEDDTVWLTQALMAELFQTTKQNISLHIINVFSEGELDQISVVKEYLTTAADGKKYSTSFYNLDVILSVGYRVRSHRGTQFRKWATERLREYLVKGFTMDDERLKEGRTLGADYFDELLERIREIRASEKRFYQKIRDIYKLSIDYDPAAGTTQEFFQIVQNKLHWAITGRTAAEIIAQRADAGKPNMGLTSWKGAKVRRQDVAVAKNYLNEKEIRDLNRIVTMYLDYAEMQAERRKPLYMRDWKEKLDAFLRFNERQILEHAGTVSMEVAKKLALEQYEKFEHTRLAADAALPDDDFDRVAKQLEHKSEKGARRKKK